jgi:hypothetical protein
MTNQETETKELAPEQSKTRKRKLLRSVKVRETEKWNKIF